jgi:hypothetical protein
LRGTKPAPSDHRPIVKFELTVIVDGRGIDRPCKGKNVSRQATCAQGLDELCVVGDWFTLEPFFVSQGRNAQPSANRDHFPTLYPAHWDEERSSFGSEF